jgi:ribosome modulation factor
MAQDPKRRGWNAWQAGRDQNQNPYDTGSPDAQAWLEGWWEADKAYQASPDEAADVELD